MRQLINGLLTISGVRVLGISGPTDFARRTLEKLETAICG